VETVPAGTRNEIALHAYAWRISRVSGNLDIDLLEQERGQSLVGPAAIAHHISNSQAIDHLDFIARRAAMRAELRSDRRSDAPPTSTTAAHR